MATVLRRSRRPHSFPFLDFIRTNFNQRIVALSIYEPVLTFITSAAILLLLLLLVGMDLNSVSTRDQLSRGLCGHKIPSTSGTRRNRVVRLVADRIRGSHKSDWN